MIRPDHTALTRYSAEGALSIWQHHGDHLNDPRWRPDGKEVAYEEIVMRRGKMPENNLIVRPWPDGAELRISAPGCSFTEPAWSPDGAWLLYRESCGGFQWGNDHLVIAPREDLLRRTEVCDGEVLVAPDWGPNNRVLGISVSFPRPAELYVCEISM